MVSAGFSVLSGVVKHPLTKEAEFPFSITYKYNSETITINEQYVCEFVGADAETFSQIRFWNGYIKGYENSDDYIVSETESGTLYNGDGADMICQIIYCVPAFSVFCLALSLSLRRKGFSKSGFVVQFIGPLVFALLLFCF